MHVVTVDELLLFISAVSTAMSLGMLLMLGRKIPVSKEVDISEIVALAPYHSLEPEITVQGSHE